LKDGYFGENVKIWEFWWNKNWKYGCFVNKKLKIWVFW